MCTLCLSWPGWFFYVLAGILGACLGSFANVCIVRMPEGRSIVRPASHCPKCSHKIRFWENIPIFSYLFLKGRCSKCGSTISFVYPLVEVIMAGLSIFAWWYFRNPIPYLVYVCLFLLPMLIVTFIDLKHMIIPDSISIPGIVVGLIVHTLFKIDGDYLSSFIDSVAGILVGGGLLFLVAFAYEKLKKKEGLGGGDIKLIAMLGAFFGWKSVVLILLLSSLLGSIIGLVLILIFRKDSEYAIPYGPFLVLAGILNLFWGQELIFWYLGLFR